MKGKVHVELAKGATYNPTVAEISFGSAFVYVLFLVYRYEFDWNVQFAHPTILALVSLVCQRILSAKRVYNNGVLLLIYTWDCFLS